METKNVVLNKYAKDFFGKYLDDDNINEICYQGGNLIWFEDVLGNWGSEESSMDEQKANSFAQAAASFKNDKIDKTKPIMSCILPTGERVQVVIQPATSRGVVSITIRKPSKVRYKLDDYIRNGSLDGETAAAFAEAVKNGKNSYLRRNGKRKNDLYENSHRLHPFYRSYHHHRGRRRDQILRAQKLRSTVLSQ